MNNDKKGPGGAESFGTLRRNAFVLSNGCVPNRLGGLKLSAFLESSGYRNVHHPGDADIIILNFCGYSGSKIAESKKELAETMKKKKENCRIFITGCLDHIAPEVIDDCPGGKLVNFDDLSRHLINMGSFNALAISGPLIDKLETTKRGIFNLVTSKGCLGVCSYCAIRFARGTIKSTPIAEIISEFTRGLADGYRTFILWGDDLGAYGRDLGTSYIALINALVAAGSKHSGYRLLLHRLNPQWLKNYL